MAITVAPWKLSLLSSLLLSGLGDAASLKKRASVVPTNLPNGWVYAGCYIDSAGSRSLSGMSTASDSTMTDDYCINYCAANNFIYAGTEYAAECYCDNQLSAAQEPDSDCNMPCNGNTTETCGAGNRLTVFLYNSSTPLGPPTNPGPNGYGSIGCYNDTAAARTLGTQVQVTGGPDNMTVANCVSACSAAGFSLAGTEYARECCESPKAKWI